MFNAFAAELMKWRRTPFVAVTIAAALSPPLLTLLSYGIRGVTPAWTDVMRQSVFFYVLFTGPLTVTLIGAQSIANEYQNDTWKLSLAAPVSRESVYTAKALVGFIWVGFLSVLTFCASLLAGVLLHADKTIDLADWLAAFAVIWPGMFAMLPVYHLITLISRSFFVTSGVGIVGTFLGLMFFNSKYAGLYPSCSVLVLAGRFPGFKAGESVQIGDPAIWVAILTGVALAGLIASLLYLRNAEIR